VNPYAADLFETRSENKNDMKAYETPIHSPTDVCAVVRRCCAVPITFHEAAPDDKVDYGTVPRMTFAARARPISPPVYYVR
jgi:hypothetical protein